MKKHRLILTLLIIALCLSGCAVKLAEPAAQTAPEAPAAPEASAAPGCTISIRCDVLLDNMDALDAEKRDLVPQDGCLLTETTVPLEENDTVFDVLQRVVREQKLQMEFNTTPLYDSKYIEGIGNLYEMDAGALSGWTFSINGTFPGCGLNLCPVSDGDVIQILYTCDLGADVGNVYLGE